MKMEKTIAVIATEKEYAEFLKTDVEKYLGEYAKFSAYSIGEVREKEEIRENFVLISAFNIFQEVRSKISRSSEIIVLSLSLNKSQMESIKWIPKGTRALLVNFDNRSCMHTITSLYDAGYRDVELIPYYGVGEYDHDIKLAITPNEAHLVPKGIETVINVGESSVSVNSLYDIADKLGVYEDFAAKGALAARKEYYYISSGLDRLLNEKSDVLEKLNTLVSLMNEGIIITDENGRIYLSNKKAGKILKSRSNVISGFNITDILPELNPGPHEEKLIKIDGRNVFAEVINIESERGIIGYIVNLSDFEEMEEKQHGIRSRVAGVNHVAKYTFSDIVGNSEVIRSAIETAKRFASSESSIMITGESGTGKEMFAQSIHNASERKRYNFVAVNCAAIPENLLESEMFGYEEGSFTGAKKGGQVGLFELAHRGTIFLDEIGEMPVQLQSKLLRTIEEKKVMRVGANKNIDIDVRIIAATNKNLLSLVNEGRFREDLYYRLNVLPLKIPSLSERKEDISDIFGMLASNIGYQAKLTDGAKAYLEKYPWPGNVRELRNVVEYLSNTGKNTIDISDVSFLNSKSESEKKSSEHFKTFSPNDDDVDMYRFLLHEGRDAVLMHEVLTTMNEAREKGERRGRLKLAESINSAGAHYSEGEIRTILNKLSFGGYIKVLKGRGGSEITDKGVRFLELMSKLVENGVIGR
jgi:transcriptional regulator with PAS, ATPase and Fis domain